MPGPFSHLEYTDHSFSCQGNFFSRSISSLVWCKIRGPMKIEFVSDENCSNSNRHRSKKNWMKYFLSLEPKKRFLSFHSGNEIFEPRCRSGRASAGSWIGVPRRAGVGAAWAAHSGRPRPWWAGLSSWSAASSPPPPTTRSSSIYCECLFLPLYSWAKFPLTVVHTF